MKMIVVYVIKIILILAVMILYFLFFNYNRVYVFGGEKILEAELSDFKPGDILLVSYGGRFFSRGGGGMKYNHTGMVCIKDNVLSVCEVAEYDEMKNFFIIPLSKWLRINRKHIIMLNSAPYPQDNEKILSFYEKNKNITRKSNFVDYINPFLSYSPIKDGKEYSCIEVTGELMILLNYIDPLPLQHIHPNHFDKMSGFNLKVPFNSYILNLEKLEYYIDSFNF